MNLKLNLACDDINPLKGYRILGEKPETWFRKLNEDYGLKFDIFVPSNFHNQAPLSRHQTWVKELASLDWISLNGHGHFHMTSNPQRFGECEFAELVDDKLIERRLEDCMMEWQSCGIYIDELGWRNPGWLCSTQSKNWIEQSFKYVALHYEHNQNLQWNCKTFFGHDGIQQENISIHNEDMIMFQSHIYGKHNHNVWNEQNYDQLRMSLDHLFENFNIEPVLLKECL